MRAICRKNRMHFAITNVIEALESRKLLSASLSGTVLNVTGTSGTDTVAISDSSTTITVKINATTYTFADSSVSKIVVNPTAGGDTTNLLSNTKPITITGMVADTVNIGDSGIIQGIAASVTVTNSQSYTNLTVDAGMDGLPISGILTASTVTGLSPGAINYTAAQLSALTIITSTKMTVNDTGVLHGNVPTLIESDPAFGGLQVLTLGTTGPLTVNLQPLGGSAQVGQGNVQNIKGYLLIEMDPIWGTDLTIDDSADLIGRTITVDSNLKITGIAPATIEYRGAVADSDLTVSAGMGNDNITIGGGAFDAFNTYYCGGGNDTVTFLSATVITNIYGQDGNDTLIETSDTELEESVNFDGGIGTNSIVVNHSEDTAGRSYEIGDTYISFGGLFDFITFTNVSALSLFGGSGSDTVVSDAGISFPLLIHGGRGDDSIEGGDKNDSLFGDAGNDTVNGEAGNDLLNGGTGSDVLNLSTGIDSLDGGEGAPIQIVGDNVGAQGVTVTGAWTPSTFNSGFVGTNYFTDGNSGKGTKSVAWAPTIPVAGSYQVYARWTASSNRSNNVPIDVVHQGITSTVFVNEQTNNNAWVSLGTYALNSGNSSSVKIRTTGTTGYVIADAVMFVPVTPTGSIIGYSFNDANGSSGQDHGELGVPGRTVYIDSNKNGIFDAGEKSVVTDAGGNWELDGLAAGTYRVREQNVAGFFRTIPIAHADYYDLTVKVSATASVLQPYLFGDYAKTPNPVVALAVNAGGPTFVLSSGVTFAADHGSTGGAAVTNVFDVQNTDNDPLYYSVRSGASFSYALPVANGSYSMSLFFCDPTYTVAGQRKFNIKAEGSTIFSNFDVIARAGAGKSATSVTVPVTVTDGVLNLSFTGVVNNAIVSGIELYAFTAAPSLAQTAIANSSASVFSSTKIVSASAGDLLELVR